VKKQFLSFAGLFAIIIGATALSVQAQASRVHVPFDFTVNNRTLPAGEYELDRMAGRPVVAIRPVATKGSGTFAIVFDGNVADNREQWTFHRYGEKYFLVSVDVSGYRLDLPSSRKERQLLAANTTPQAEQVAIMVSRL
jgi:hypothetical protein